MAELTGQIFAGYEILAKLGQGGMGAVYKARQSRLNRLAALKVLSPDLAADPGFVTRFQREASAAANLSHPNVVQVYSAGEHEGTHYIAMEFVDGETLREHIERHGRLHPREAVAVAVYVAEALQYGWTKARLIHRDIKPENIFLSKTGEVKVGDLGLAKTVGGRTTSLTQTGIMMGSPHYISPEQARGMSDIDFKTDIYSLGCTLFHMLTGHPPYTGTDPLVVIHKHVNDPPPAIFKVWPTCPIPLALAVGKMLAKNRNDRPASYEDLIEQLQEVHDKLKPGAAPAPASASKPAQVITATPTPGPAQSTPKPVVVKATTTRPTVVVKAKHGSHAMLYAAAGVAAIAVIAGVALWSPWKQASTTSQDAGFQSLFNGKDLSGWRVREQNKRNAWSAHDGLLVNSERGTDLVTEEWFTDFQFHCEFMLPPGGNSGVYLRGRYEVQIMDDFGKPADAGGSGGIWQLVAPTENASKPAGEWQTLDARIVGKRVEVVLNGKKVVDDAELPKPTQGAFDGNVNLPGPVLLQGSISGVSFRNLRIKPLETAAASALAASRQPRQTLDLLALADPIKDRVTVSRGASHSKANRWERRGNNIVYLSDDGSGKLAPAVAINARSYAIVINFERLSGSGRFHVDLPLDATQIIPMTLDNPGIKMINTRAGEPWPENHDTRARVTVRLDRGVNGRPDKITVRIDDKLVMEWHGNANSVAQNGEPHPDFPGQPVTSLYSHKDSYQVRFWQLRVFEGEATVLHGAATTAARPASPASSGSYDDIYVTQAATGEKIPHPLSRKTHNVVLSDNKTASIPEGMVLVPEGSFKMGSNDHPIESPPHDVHVQSFLLDEYEVTNAQYLEFVKATQHPMPSHWSKNGGRIPPGRENHPVTHVSWEDAKAYCDWCGKRLPTEAEWEKAASWDPVSNTRSRHPWGNQYDNDPSRPRANWAARWVTDGHPQDQTAWNEFSRTEKYKEQVALGGLTLPVGSFALGVSPAKCFDMAGSVWEWTADWFDKYPGNTASLDAQTEAQCGQKARVMRGVSCECHPLLGRSLSCTDRAPGGSKKRAWFLGFRCAMDWPLKAGPVAMR